jgi:hypothetical protein
MSNHVHLKVSAKNRETSDILRDFKKFTRKQIIKAITEHPGESRKHWMLNIFKQASEQNSRNTTYQFWRQDNHPIVLITTPFINQKLEYIHNKPVVAGMVDKAEEYLYSSARDYYNGKQSRLLKLVLL